MNYFTRQLSIKELQEKLPGVVMSLLLAFGLTISFISPFVFVYSPAQVIIVSFAIHFLLFFFTRNKKLFIGVLAVFALLLFIWVAYSAASGRFETYLPAIFGFFDWFVNITSGTGDPSSPYAAVLTAIITILFSLAVFFFAYYKLNFYIIIFVSLGLFSLQIIFGLSPNPVAFYFIILLCLLFYCRHVYRKHKQKFNDYNLPSGIFVLYSIPFCLAIFLLAFWIPKSESPLELPRISIPGSPFADLSSRFPFLGEHSDFSVSMAGFGSASDLGGEVELSGRPVMSVIASQRTYLKGSVRNIYTGSSWTLQEDRRYELPIDTEFDFDEDIKGDFSYKILEKFQAPSLFVDSPESFEIPYANYDITVDYMDMRTRVIFRPDFPRQLRLRQDYFDVFEISRESILYGKSNLSRGFGYLFRYKGIDYSDRTYIDLLRQSYPGFYQDILTEENNNFSNSGITREQVEELNVYSKRMRENYLDLPESLPERVGQLAEEITAHAQNDYDRAKALESFLSENHPYTLSPPTTPDDRDFVDFFLFDVKEGYCVYYASAMAVMLRTLDIPSRYVQGYMMPSQPDIPDFIFPPETSFGSYLVTSDNAHAWVEAYLEGFGWIPFEPTAAFTSSFYDFDPTAAHERDESQIFPPREETQVYSATAVVFAALFALSAVVFIFITLILINLIKSRRIISNAKGMENKDAVMFISNNIKQTFAALGISRFSYETQLEYFERIRQNISQPRFEYSEILLQRLESFFDVYLLTRYGNKVIENSCKSLAIEVYGSLMGETKQSIGKFRFFVYRYIFGSF